MQTAVTGSAENAAFRMYGMAPGEYRTDGTFVPREELRPSVIVSFGKYILNRLTAAEGSRIVIPEYIDAVGCRAFEYGKLSCVIFPDSLTDIMDGAFGRSRLRTAVLPENILSVGAGAFEFSQLRSVYLPSSLRSAGRNAFRGCRGLTAAGYAGPRQRELFRRSFAPDGGELPF